MDYIKILQEIKSEIEPLLCKGKVADYIPALAEVNPDRFAMSIQLLDGRIFEIGQCDWRFSIQSISKIFAFTLVLKLLHQDLCPRMGHEPSGNPFNSLVQLEYEKGIPRNPFINAGAIVVTDILTSHYKEETFEVIMRFIQELSDDSSVSFDAQVANSEEENGFRNLALVNMMKSFGNINNSIFEIMRTYFHQCSISMSSKQLCRAMLFLANHGKDPLCGKEFITESQSKRISSLMLTCGHYDASGDFAFRVGLPGKSGVGGGIVAIIPNLMSLCVYSPRLNENGNSLAGTKALELFTTKTGFSIF
ncbi:MAG: glutaminase [Sulfurospirillum sp.]|nr:glutaminase [Sulfurospirillum sp.]